MSRVWYAAYGSNLRAERFGCYLAGGRPPGGARTYPGCRDPSPPTGDISLELPGSLLFAGESQVWGGGMAFLDPQGSGRVACRAYQLTTDQLADVVAQEMRLDPGGEFATALVAALPGIGRLHRMGPGRYETVVRVGTHEGLPVLTVTSGDLRALELSPPSAAYLRTIATGLTESHRWSPTRIATYLSSVPGARGTWSAEAVLKAVESAAC